MYWSLKDYPLSYDNTNLKSEMVFTLTWLIFADLVAYAQTHGIMHYYQAEGV